MIHPARTGISIFLLVVHGLDDGTSGPVPAAGWGE
jgi:hypothetical protein